MDRLTRQIYPQLKRLARNRGRGSALGATTLVHETYAKLLNGEELSPRDRNEFFCLAATIMRRIVIDEVRRAGAAKRDGIRATAEDERLVDAASVKADFLVAVDQALTDLADTDQRLVQVFEFRYFAGCSTAETAEALGLSVRTVERLWSQARRAIAEFIG